MHKEEWFVISAFCLSTSSVYRNMLILLLHKILLFGLRPVHLAFTGTTSQKQFVNFVFKCDVSEIQVHATVFHKSRENL